MKHTLEVYSPDRGRFVTVADCDTLGEALGRAGHYPERCRVRSIPIDPPAGELLHIDPERPVRVV